VCNKTTKRLALAAVALMTVVAARQARAMTLPDRIVRHSGAPITQIKVTKLDIDTVEYTTFRGEAPTKSIDASKVKEVFLGDAGRFRLAISLAEKGENWERVLALVKRSPEKGPREFWYAPNRLVLYGRALLETGKPAEALPKFEEVIRKYPKSFYVLRAIRGKARAHMELDQNEKAAETYRKLVPYGKIWALRARYRMAQIYTRIPDKTSEAGDLYQRLVAECERLIEQPPAAVKDKLDEVKSIHQSALIGRADVLMHTGKLAEARQWVNSIEKKVTDESARVKLYLALGDLAMQAARNAASAENKKINYRKALLPYMRVYILYPDRAEARRRAMLGAAMASELYGSPPDRSRAKRLYKELYEKFPKSREAENAKKRLEAMGVKVDNG
jgi:tetratricopeptide (TPR) repeat protein